MKMSKYKTSLLAKIKSILPQFIINYFEIIEFCQRCGIQQPIAWHCKSDELWKKINGTKNGVQEKGIFIMWYPEVFKGEYDGTA
jgi:hypothetical protein